MNLSEKFAKTSTARPAKMAPAFHHVYPQYSTASIIVNFGLLNRPQDIRLQLTKKEAETLANELLKFAAYLDK